MRGLAAWGTSPRRQTAWPCLALWSTEGVSRPYVFGGRAEGTAWQRGASPGKLGKRASVILLLDFFAACKDFWVAATVSLGAPTFRRSAQPTPRETLNSAELSALATGAPGHSSFFSKTERRGPVVQAAGRCIVGSDQAMLVRKEGVMR